MTTDEEKVFLARALQDFEAEVDDIVKKFANDLGEYLQARLQNYKLATRQQPEQPQAPPQPPQASQPPQPPQASQPPPQASQPQRQPKGYQWPGLKKLGSGWKPRLQQLWKYIWHGNQPKTEHVTLREYIEITQQIELVAQEIFSEAYEGPLDDKGLVDLFVNLQKTLKDAVMRVRTKVGLDAEISPSQQRDALDDTPADKIRQDIEGGEIDNVLGKPSSESEKSLQEKTAKNLLISRIEQLGSGGAAAPPERSWFIKTSGEKVGRMTRNRSSKLPHADILKWLIDNKINLNDEEAVATALKRQTGLDVRGDVVMQTYSLLGLNKAKDGLKQMNEILSKLGDKQGWYPTAAIGSRPVSKRATDEDPGDLEAETQPEELSRESPPEEDNSFDDFEKTHKVTHQRKLF